LIPKSETVQSVPIFDEIAVRAKVSSPVRTIIPSKQESTSVPDASLSTRRRIPFSLEHSFEKRSVQNPQPADPASAPDLDSVVTEGGTDREPVQAGGIAAQITARRAGRKPPPDDPAQTRRSDRRFAASNVVAPEPTIQVTIGRVEVRATAASPVIRPPRAAPQTMSLEDYLRRRAGGTSHE
jgi:hypothetical protein